MVIAHPSEVRLHFVLSLSYTLRAGAIAVTLPFTPLADGKPPVGRTRVVFIYKSPVLRAGLVYTDGQYTFE